MSDINDTPDLSALTGSPPPHHKRKRDPDSPSLRSKRFVSAGPMSPSETAAFIESAIEANNAATANGVNVADFNALQQAAHAADHDASDPNNATSTAQAALGMYPTLHVPPTTEEQFAAQAAGDPDHHHHHHHTDHTFNPDVTHESLLEHHQVHQAHQNQVNAARFVNEAVAHNAKPTVGSEEWHKQRKDNHKEGKALSHTLSLTHTQHPRR